jgi:acyl-CoA thioesterase
MGFSDVDSDNKPMSFQQTCEKKMLVHQQELAQKEEEMKQQFIQRVKEKESELKEAERDVKPQTVLTSTVLLSHHSHSHNYVFYVATC